MISYQRLAVFCLLFLLGSLPLFGQYTTTYNLAVADVLNSTTSPSSTYNCVSDNCFVELPVTAIFTQLTASSDGEVQAIDNAGERWRWDIPSQTWTELCCGPLSGIFKAIHVGSVTLASYLAITTEASNNTYYWNPQASVWDHLGTGTLCTDGTVTADGHYYCIESGNVLQWNGSSWTTLRNLGDAETLAANSSGGVAVINSSSNLYLWSGSGTTWTQVTGLGFTPKQWVGSLAMADYDGSITIMDSSLNVHVSHDNGTTWTAPNHSGISIQQVVDSASINTFVLAGSGAVYHLNTIVPQTQMSISGTCGSACSSGNPALVVSYQSTGTNTQFTCPSPWIYWTIGVIDCGFDTNANTVLNTPVVSSFEPGCDSFAPGTQCKTPNTLTIAIYVSTLTATIVYQALEDCECVPKGALINQKYKVTSSNWSGVKPTATRLFGLINEPGDYEWDNTSLSQWCKGKYVPSVTGDGVTVEYVNVAVAPAQMPGQYINGDLIAVVFPDGTYSKIPFSLNLTNFAVGGGELGSAGIYTWNNTSTSRRGTGGDPTTLCQGNAIP
jgi:hypothetical protein